MKCLNSKNMGYESPWSKWGCPISPGHVFIKINFFFINIFFFFFFDYNLILNIDFVIIIKNN